MTRLNYYFDWDRMTAEYKQLRADDDLDDTFVQQVPVYLFRAARGIYEAAFARSIAREISDYEASLTTHPERALCIDYDENALYALESTLEVLDANALRYSDVAELLLDAYCGAEPRMPDDLTEAEARAIAATWAQGED